MVVTTQPLMAESFDAFAELPENADKLLEFIGGEIYEVESRPYASMIAVRFSAYIGQWVREKKLGHVTGKRGGYQVSGDRYMPDVAFISSAKQPELPYEGYVPNSPDLVVEIDSPSTYESQTPLRIKVVNYLAAGTVVWVVYPHNQKVEIYIPGKPVKILDINGIIEGEPVLPGFKLPVKDIFPG